MKKQNIEGSAGGNGKDNSPIGTDIRKIWTHVEKHGSPEGKEIAKYMQDRFSKSINHGY